MREQILNPVSSPTPAPMGSQIPDLSAISSEGDRVAALLRQTAQQQQQPPGTSDILDSMIAAYGNSRNPNSGALSAYTTTMKGKQEEANKKQQQAVASEKDIYNYMVQAKQLGDVDTAKMKEGLDTLVGNDPQKQMQVIKYVTEKYPGMKIDSTNYLQPAVEATQSLGLKNDDMEFTKKKNALTLQGLQADISYKNAKAGQGAKRQTAVVGNVLVDTTTGQPIYTGAGGAGGKPPSGYQFKTDGTLEPITGGPADKANMPMDPTNAAKSEMLIQGYADAKRFDDVLMKNGKPDRQLLTQMNPSTWYGGEGSPVPGTPGGQAYSLIYNSVEARMRAESGQAVPEQEVSRMARRFIPKATDSDDTIISKKERLKEYLGGALDLINPTYRGKAEALYQGGVGGRTPQQQEVTATNPQTGQKIVLRNGQWEPLQ